MSPIRSNSLTRRTGFAAFLLWLFSVVAAVAASQPHSISTNEPFFPIGIFSVNPPAAFPELKAAGFNTVHTYEAAPDYLKKYVTAAEQADLKVLIYPGERIGLPKGKRPPEQFNQLLLEQTVRKLSASKAVLAWYLCDEPDQLGVPAVALERYRAHVRSLDLRHPTAGAVWKAKDYKEYAEGADIFMVDPYPIPKEPLTMVSDRIELARQATGGKKPIWAVLQAFGYQSERNDGWGWKREPTEAELRAMTWLAVVHGVQGIFYYTYHGSKYYIKESPQLWDSLKSVVRELNELSQLLTSPIPTDKLFRTNGRIHYSIRKVAHGGGELAAGTYLVAVNTAPSPQDASYQLQGWCDSCTKAMPLHEIRTIVVRNGRIPDRMEPFAVKFYKLGN